MTAALSSAVSRSDLLAAAGDDQWVRWGLGDPLPGAALVHADVAVVQRLGHRPGIWVAPLRRKPGATPTGRAHTEEAVRVRSALQLVVDSGLLEVWGARSASVPAEHADLGRQVLPLTDEGGDWEWMWTTTPPPRDPREAQLVLLDDTRDAPELADFAHAHNPRVWTRIGEGVVDRWVGARDGDGRLLAVGGAEREDSGVPHLAGILTATSARGQGWGQVVSASLTRWALHEHGVATLGMFTDNDVARRLYRRLGYRTARRWCSRRLRAGRSGVSSGAG